MYVKRGTAVALYLDLDKKNSQEYKNFLDSRFAKRRLSSRVHSENPKCTWIGAK